jgi:hypothetical protein
MYCGRNRLVLHSGAQPAPKARQILLEVIDGLHAATNSLAGWYSLSIFRAISARRLGLPVPRPRKLSLGCPLSRLRRYFRLTDRCGFFKSIVAQSIDQSDMPPIQRR